MLLLGKPGNLAGFRNVLVVNPDVLRLGESLRKNNFANPHHIPNLQPSWIKSKSMEVIIYVIYTKQVRVYIYNLSLRMYCISSILLHCLPISFWGQFKMLVSTTKPWMVWDLNNPSHIYFSIHLNNQWRFFSIPSVKYSEDNYSKEDCSHCSPTVKFNQHLSRFLSNSSGAAVSQSSLWFFCHLYHNWIVAWLI